MTFQDGSTSQFSGTEGFAADAECDAGSPGASGGSAAAIPPFGLRLQANDVFRSGGGDAKNSIFMVHDGFGILHSSAPVPEMN